MPLTDRFQLLDLKRDEGARTFEAREIATGRPVLVHLFANRTAPLTRVLLSKLDALPAAERQRVIDRGDHEGGIYVVTDRLAEYPGLREWLADHRAEPPKSLDSASAWQTLPALKAAQERSGAPPANPTVDDQFAHLFDTAPLPVLEPSPTAPSPNPVLSNTSEQTLKIPKPPPPPPPPQPAKPPVAPARQGPPSIISAPPGASNEPGEFTRQFAPVLRPVPPPAPPPQTAPASPAASNEPGEFTRQFAPVLRPTPPPPAPPAAAPNDPGEFTRQFAPVTRPAAPPSQPVASTPAASNEPGEFTRQFAPVLRPASPPASPPTSATQSSGEFTNLFPAAGKPQERPGEFTSQFQSPPRPVSATPRTLAPPPPSPQQDGEFTQLLKARGAAPPTPPAPKAPDFDDYFQSPLHSPLAPASPGSVDQTKPLVHPNRSGRGGEYTQLFGPDDIPTAPLAPTTPPSGATQVFRPPSPPPAPAMNLPPPNPPQAFTPSPLAAPVPVSDEWGKMFDHSNAINFGGPAKETPPVAPPSAPRNNISMPLLLIVGGVVLLLIAVIVYLAMRPH